MIGLNACERQNLHDRSQGNDSKRSRNHQPPCEAHSRHFRREARAALLELVRGLTAKNNERSRAAWSPSRHRARRPQLPDRGVVIAGTAKNLIAVLADPGRMPRRGLLAAVDPDRAVDG